MSKDLPQPQQSEEVDLGQLFKLIGNIFDRFFKFIGSILNKLFLAFVWMVFFVKKHFIKIALAGIIGFALGFTKDKISVPSYSSSAIIKQNYNTGEVLYEAVEYYNKLVEEEDTITLANDLNINFSKASSIKGFSIKAVTNDNIRIKSYDIYIKSLDSVLASTITYDDYLDFSKEFDVPFQKFDLQTYTNDSYEDIIIEVVNKIKTSPYFLNAQLRDLNELRGRENALKQTLQKSDSLQAVYQEVLMKTTDLENGGQTSITIDNTEDKSITKEYELFQSDLALRRELVEIERAKEEKKDIIEIVSIEKGRGVVQNKVIVFGVELSRPIVFALILVILTFMLLMSQDFLIYLDRYKNKI